MIVCSILTVMSVAQAADSKKLICTSVRGGVFGLSSTSTDLYVGAVGIKSEELFSDAHKHGRVGIDYDAKTDTFSGNGEDGCVQVAYQTYNTPDGVKLVETEGEGGQTTYSCALAE